MRSSNGRGTAKERLQLWLAGAAATVCAIGVIVLAIMGSPQVLLIALALCAAVALIELAAIVSIRSQSGH